MPSLPFFAGFKAIYFDNRGTGLSDKPEGPYTVEDMAMMPAILLKALDIPRAKVFGVFDGWHDRAGIDAAASGAGLSKPCSRARCWRSQYSDGRARRDRDGDGRIEADDDRSGKGFDNHVAALMPPADFVAAHPEIKQMLWPGPG